MDKVIQIDFLRSLFPASYSRFIFTGLIPFSYLSVMNLIIFKKLRMNQKSRVRSKSTLTKSAGNLATILVLIGKGNSFLI